MHVRRTSNQLRIVSHSIRNGAFQSRICPVSFTTKSSSCRNSVSKPEQHPGWPSWPTIEKRHGYTHMNKLECIFVVVFAIIAQSIQAFAASYNSSPPVFNVKDPPYNATGDGVTDDSLAIATAISDAAGREVYLPVGTYLIATPRSAINTPSSSVVLVGESRDGAILKVGTNLNPSGVFINLGANCSNSWIRSLTIDGNKANQNAAMNSLFINNGANNCVVQNVRIVNSSAIGIAVGGAKNTIIHDCAVEQSEMQGIWLSTTSNPHNVNTILRNNRVIGFGYDGIQATNDTTIEGNYVAQLQGNAAGIFCPTDHLLNIKILGNTVRQCGAGIDVGGISTGGPNSSGVIISGNTVSENYGGGISSGASGTVFVGNQTNDNGIAISGVFTMEPGVIPDYLAFPGTGYSDGDILTLQGGTFTRPAKFRVKRPGLPPGPLDDNNRLTLVDPGDYSVFPNTTGASISVTGGTGQNARVWYSNVRLSGGGSGYTVGSILQGSNGSMRYPPKFRVEAVSAGAITAFSVLGGGGYSSVPTNSIINVTTISGAGTGATFVAQFANRFQNTPATAVSGLVIGQANSLPNSGCVVTSNTSINSLPPFSPQNAGVLISIASGAGSNWPTNWLIANNNVTGYNGSTNYAINGQFANSFTSAFSGAGIIASNQGYNFPNNQNANYTLSLGDMGKVVWHNSASSHTYTIPANSSVSFPLGCVITVVNYTASGTLTIQPTAPDNIVRGDGVQGIGARTMAPYSVARLTKLTGTIWMIDGTFQ
jgi:Pectate lyase superfamily protein